MKCEVFHTDHKCCKCVLYSSAVDIDHYVCLLQTHRIVIANKQFAYTA